MKTFSLLISLLLFALGCSGDKADTPFAAEIKSDPLAAADQVVDAVCACKDTACLDGLKKTEIMLKKALNAQRKESPDAAQKATEKLDAFKTKTKACIADLSQ